MGASLNDIGDANEKFSVFVETGTFLGHTTERVARLFRTVYTIELSPEIYLATRARLSDHANVVFINGDSATEVQRLCGEIDEPAVFFLDAHFAGGNTAFGAKEVPLYEELSAIAERAWCDLIIIDDFRLFDKTGTSGSDDSEIYPTMIFDWRGITLEGCLDIFARRQKEVDHLVFDDRVYLLKRGTGLDARGVSDLGVARPHPNLSTTPPGATLVIPVEAATQVDGVVFDSEYGQGVAVTPGEMRHFALHLQFECEEGDYELWTLYCAAEKRPLQMRVDDALVKLEIAENTTGGWYPPDLKWHPEAMLRLSQGKHHIHLRRDGWFPHLARLALVPKIDA